MKKACIAALMAVGLTAAALPVTASAQTTQCSDGTSVANPDYCVYYTPPGVTKKSPSLSIAVKPKRDRSAPIRFSVNGKLGRKGVSKTRGCRGTVTVRFKRGKKVVKRKTVPVKRSNCKYSAKRVKIKGSRLKRKGKLKVSAKFNGNSRLKTKVSKTKTVRYVK